MKEGYDKKSLVRGRGQGGIFRVFTKVHFIAHDTIIYFTV